MSDAVIFQPRCTREVARAVGGSGLCVDDAVASPRFVESVRRGTSRGVVLRLRRLVGVVGYGGCNRCIWLDSLLALSVLVLLITR